MVITFSTILLGLIALIRPLQRNRFFYLEQRVDYWGGLFYRDALFYRQRF